MLVNNAGISHAGKPGRSLEEIAKSGRLTVAALAEVRAVFETNVFGVIAVTQAMLPLLREAPAARIVNVSSTSGSLTWNSDPANPHRQMFGTYSSSKTALNAITLAFAAALESTRIKVNAACPGFTATDLNNFRARGPSNRPPVSPYVSRCSTQAARRARSRTRTARSPGEETSSHGSRPHSHSRRRPLREKDDLEKD